MGGLQPRLPVSRPETGSSPESEANRRFGRALRIVSFRWLNPSEIWLSPPAMKHFFRSCLAAAPTLIFQPTQAQDHGQVSLQFVSFPRSNDAEPVKLLLAEGASCSRTPPI
jgi:hypothetical protein